VLSVGEGVVTSQDLFHYLVAQLRDPAVPLPLRDLHDFSRVERFEVSPTAMRQAAAGTQRRPDHIREARLAVVAPRDEVYAMFRLFQLQSEHAPVIEELRRKGLSPHVRVFREHAEARAWLLSASPEEADAAEARISTTRREPGD